MVTSLLLFLILPASGCGLETHQENDLHLFYKFNPEEPLSHKNEDYVSDPLLLDQTFCLVYVVDSNTIQYANDRLIDKLRMIRHSYKIIMTKVDEACLLVKVDLKKVYTSKKIKETMELCSEMIGVPMSCIYPVKNYHDEIEVDVVLILKAFDQIVIFANDRLSEALCIL